MGHFSSQRRMPAPTQVSAIFRSYDLACPPSPLILMVGVTNGTRLDPVCGQPSGRTSGPTTTSRRGPRADLELGWPPTTPRRELIAAWSFAAGCHSPQTKCRRSAIWRCFDEVVFEAPLCSNPVLELATETAVYSASTKNQSPI